ncbi:MAG TPA: phage portal protein [Urbifossiella sp.]|nr:phage portal protein [Urbifossiella sp.]
MRLFRRKDATPPQRKGASFYFGLAARKGGLTGAAYDRLASEGYAESVVAYACIARLAAAVASVEPQLYRKAGRRLTKIESHPLLDLLDAPNPAQSGMEFLAGLTAYHQLSGNAYVFGNGIDAARRGKPPTELQLLSPGKVRVEPGRSYFPSYFEYRPTAAEADRYPVDQVTGRSAVLQIKTFHPLSPWYGLSPLEPAAVGVDIHSAGQRWNKGLIENGARPSGALVVKAADGKPADLSEEQYQRLKEMIAQQFSGSGNSGKPMLLEGGLEWQEMSLNPKDMDFLNGKHSAARDIALAFGVPPQLLGIPGDSTFSNYKEAKLALWTDTVIPLIRQYLGALNRWLTPLFGPDLYLWYDEEMIPALEELRSAKATRINAATYLTLDEKRAAMGYGNYTPSDTPGGTILVPSTNVPLELAGAMTMPEPGSPDDPHANKPDGGAP